MYEEALVERQEFEQAEKLQQELKMEAEIKENIKEIRDSILPPTDEDPRSPFDDEEDFSDLDMSKIGASAGKLKSRERNKLKKKEY